MSGSRLSFGKSEVSLSDVADEDRDVEDWLLDDSLDLELHLGSEFATITVLASEYDCARGSDRYCWLPRSVSFAKVAASAWRMVEACS